MPEGKIRKHIKVSSEMELDFEKITLLIVELVKEQLNDELVSFVYIEDGLKEGTFNPNQNDDLPCIPEKGTMMRVFTKESRWSFILIRRDRNGGFVTLIDVSAPKKDEEAFKKVMDYLIKETKGEISGDI